MCDEAGEFDFDRELIILRSARSLPLTTRRRSEQLDTVVVAPTVTRHSGGSPRVAFDWPRANWTDSTTRDPLIRLACSTAGTQLPSFRRSTQSQEQRPLQ